MATRPYSFENMPSRELPKEEIFGPQGRPVSPLGRVQGKRVEIPAGGEYIRSLAREIPPKLMPEVLKFLRAFPLFETESVAQDLLHKLKERNLMLSMSKKPTQELRGILDEIEKRRRGGMDYDARNEKKAA